MQQVTVKDLQEIEFLQEVPVDQLQWLIEESEHYIVKAGEFILREGDPITKMLILISGTAELFRTQNNSRLSITHLHKGSITGLLPFSRVGNAAANGLCTEDTQMMSLTREKIKEVIIHRYELTQALVHVMTTRVRDYTAFEQQTEKMLALGKLSAGLAHELNNPAAAIVRGSISLKKHLDCLPSVFRQLIALHITEAELDLIHEKLMYAIENPPLPLTMMQRSNLEDEINDWIEAHEIANPMDMAEVFVEFGIDSDVLDELNEKVPVDHLEPVLHWICNNLTSEQMVTDLQAASKRIADLVGSVKVYTHMDGGGDKVLSDLHAGIRNTLVMLNYKIKKAGIKVIEDFDETLPNIKAMIGELNQVWTNLIDNATDALESQPNPELTIKTRKVDNDVKVYITDNGPGIPDLIKSKVFNPFFTTKEIGKGTGLGLDVVSRIVKQHNGSVELSSVPGKTEFIICFPING
jgi:signal transduction histidine kinase